MWSLQLLLFFWGNVMPTQEFKFKPNDSNAKIDSEAASGSIRTRRPGASVQGGLSATRVAESFVPVAKRQKFRHDPKAIRRGKIEHQRYEREVLLFYADREVSRRKRLKKFMIKPYLFVFLVAVFIISLPFWLS